MVWYNNWHNKPIPRETIALNGSPIFCITNKHYQYINYLLKLIISMDLFGRISQQFMYGIVMLVVQHIG